MVCKFFELHPLRTRKQNDFVKFQMIANLMSDNRHLGKDGLVEIVDLAMSVNTTKRPVLEKIRYRLIG